MAERILIVDDESDMLMLLKLFLTEKSAYEVLTTPNPLEVETILQEKPVHLVVTDLIMPGRDGIEVLEAVKKFDPSLPVIIITAFGSIETAVEAVRKGAFDYITKPFRKDRIILAIEKALLSAQEGRGGMEEKAAEAASPFSVDPGWFLLPFAQAQERLLKRFQAEYARRLLVRHQGDLARAAEAAGWTLEELKALTEKGGYPPAPPFLRSSPAFFFEDLFDLFFGLFFHDQHLLGLGLLDLFRQLIQIGRFFQEIHGPQFHGLDALLHGGVAGEENDLQLRSLGLEDLERLQAVDPRHHQVQDDHVIGLLFHLFQGFDAGAGSSHLHSPVAHPFRKGIQKLHFIIHQ